MDKIIIDIDFSKSGEYHLRKEKEKLALCGAKVKGETISLRMWGNHSNQRQKTYCKKCSKIYRRIKDE